MTKTLLLLLYLACDYEVFLERLHSLSGATGFVIFFGLYGLLAAGLFATAFLRNFWLRLGFAILFCAASILQHAFEWTTAGPLTYEAFVNLYHATGQIGDATAQHGATLLQSVLASLLLCLGILLPPRRFNLKIPAAPAIPVLLLCGLTAMLYLRGGEGARALPAAYPAISYAGLMFGTQIMTDNGPRHSPSLARSGPPIAQDIVLLVDESIVGNYLDINNPLGVRSGLDEPRAGMNIVNFGYAGSIYKCSANSNVVLRYGGTLDNYRQAISNWPSIWRYAHDSGLRTVYIDAQSNNGALQNLMTQEERAEIDDFIQFDGVPVVDRDMRIAAVLAKHINNGRPEFIYVNKIGAHFPIGDKYPETFTRYRPVLARGKSNFVSWTSDRTGFNGHAEEWVRYRNSYRNTLLWNVGEFFDRLLTKADMSKAAILYTSDHGQDLHERGNPGNNTHCGAEGAAQEEGLVPLVVIEGATQHRLDWSKALAANHDKSSDYRIFPTLLLMMGYDRAALRPNYGQPLDEAGPAELGYNVNFDPLLGKKPEFRWIDLKTIVTPPASDYAPSVKR